MPRFCYVNGRYLPHRDGAVHIEDRGYQFADGVYEVIPVHQGRMIDAGPHLDRLDYSLRELRIDPPMARRPLEAVIRQLIARNGLSNGLVYLQITRGVAPRDHKFPKAVPSALVITTKQTKPLASNLIEQGAKVVTQPDIRWQRRDIKSISLLPNILAKQAAVEQGAYEAWLVDEAGLVTEGSSTNAWIVIGGKNGAPGEIITRPRSHDILGGITRLAVIALAKEQHLRLVERAFSVPEALAADEAFLTSSSAFVLPVTQIDGRPVGTGKPGPLSQRLRQIYLRYAAGDGAK
ncbi:MAG TPA: D-amino-acid transaminase [Terriglobia bacterium]|nr:D-amino-acid transaminase [Terriglobia bacterium]